MVEIATRATARRILGELSPRGRKSLLRSILCLVVAWLLAFLPEYGKLSPDGVRALFILLFCAGLWISEAMPAFAVGLLVIGLEIVLLGKAGTESPDWEKYIATWGSPLVWLFFGGFILAAAAKKTGLDTWMAAQVLSRLGNRPALVLLGIMAATAVLSMFLSNTATTTMMVAVISPMLCASHGREKLDRAILMGIAMGANVGGMGTIIGTPPNAIAVGTLAGLKSVNFAEWMVFGIPTAFFLLAISWGYLVVAYLGREAFELKAEKIFVVNDEPNGSPKIEQAIVVTVFTVTVLMWMTSPLHGIPTTVVSFVPICALTATRTLDAEDVRGISWDVLLLIAGGLSLGLAIGETGLGAWLVAKLPLAGFGPIVVVLGIAYLTILLSNLMSNTAAANMILPMMLVQLGADHAYLVIPVALAASTAMCLPISTPPNAIVYCTGRLRSTDLVGAGLLLAVLAPLIVVGWTVLVTHFRWVSFGP